MPKNDITGKQKGHTKRYHFTMRKQAGFGLVESLLAVAILGSTVFMLLGGLSTGAISVGILQEDIVAENLARTQLEYAKSLPFNDAPFSYQSVEVVPEGYSVTMEATPVSSRDANIQRLIITIFRGDKSVYILEGFKVNR
ncbi:prepilin-type N-terminal cleavage/methylation domain-containing protein [Chloroflexota bacterium]